MVKNPPARTGDAGSSLSQKIPYIRNWQPTPAFLPEEPHGPGSLVDYSSCGRKESDTTEQLNIRNRKLY